MQRYTSFVIRHRRAVVAVFLIAALAGVALQLGVHVNYNMADYLPDSAQSTYAVHVMEESFTQAVPNASVLVPGVTVPEALDLKQRLADIDGVTAVLWLDDAADIATPLEMLDTATVESFYKDSAALFSVTIAEGMEVEATGAIRALVGEAGAITGDAMETSILQAATTAEVLNASLILVPIILLLLILSTQSWLEPLLFLAAIGVSILINMGTNLIFGEISFVTSAVSPILQLAVSLDYAIFLLHRFADYRRETDDAAEAMRRAMKKSVKAVAASALTTLFGFIALVFMDFGIGADLGFTLAKGILLSFVSCMVFLPALTLCCVKLLDRTAHRPFLPSFRNVGKPLMRLSIPMLVLVLALAVPGFLGQAQTGFTYGNVETNPDSQLMRDMAAVEETFGQSTPVVVLVPRGNLAAEQALSADLLALDHVTSVMSYAQTVGVAIPPEVLPDAVTSQFYGGGWARIIAYTDTQSEGDEAFAVVETILETARQHYGDDFYAAGQSANLYDMSQVVSRDNTRVSLIAIASIFAVLLITFRSLTLPFILLFTIEAGIWINLSIPYFTNAPINFLGYLVISTVQLGATVDYAILLTSAYMDRRRAMPKREAVRAALGESFKSILVSGTILSAAGFALMRTSSKPIISELGLLLGRGTIFSLIMVLCVLPALLTLLDGAISATTHRAGFLPKDDKATAATAPQKGENA